MSQLPPIIHKSWYEYLQPLFEDEKMQMTKDKVGLAPYFPSSQLVFRVFSMPISEVRVVILGQDPYPQQGQAIGLAFAVNKDTTPPATLKVISNEINRSGAPRDVDGDKTLQHWVDQGIFLLNTALTVEAKRSNSHTDYWVWFTRRVVDILSKHHPSIWMLWGAKAQGFKSYIHNKWIIDIPEVLSVDESKNQILQAPHPVSETYDVNNPKFTGCNHFNLCNQILNLKGQTEIKW